MKMPTEPFCCLFDINSLQKNPADSQFSKISLKNVIQENQKMMKQPKISLKQKKIQGKTSICYFSSKESQAIQSGQKNYEETQITREKNYYRCQNQQKFDSVKVKRGSQAFQKNYLKAEANKQINSMKKNFVTLKEQPSSESTRKKISFYSNLSPTQRQRVSYYLFTAPRARGKNRPENIVQSLIFP